MANDPKNKKVPESDAVWEYPWNQVVHTLGGHEIFWNSTPDQESSRVRHPSGSYTEHTKDGHKVELTANQKNTLTSNGETRVTEGAMDQMILGGLRHINLGGFQGEIAKDFSRAIYGQVLNVAKNVLTTYTDNEHHELSAQGKVSSHNDGYRYNNTKEAIVDMTTDLRIMSQQSEFMSYTGGNSDHYTKKKGRIYVEQDFKVQTNAALNILSQSDMTQTSNAKYTLTSSDTMEVTGNSDVTITGKQSITITSDQNIQIKVGSSKITISTSGITIDAGSGTVDIKGHPVKINGGGMSSPPVTYP